MARVVAVINLKGGIGKTTTVVNVSAGLALKGARVLLIDIDAQGNLAMALGVQPKRTLYEAIVDHKPLADVRVSARSNLDLVAANESLLLAHQQLLDGPIGCVCSNNWCGHCVRNMTLSSSIAVVR
jgi:ATPases involved in chromosome partitioning